jgi:hypothetical protein
MVSNLFNNIDQEVDTSIRRSTHKINAFMSFDLMIILVANKLIMRSKFKKALLSNFDLMNNLLAASAIMRSKIFMHRWLIIRAKN